MRPNIFQFPHDFKTMTVLLKKYQVPSSHFV